MAWGVYIFNFISHLFSKESALCDARVKCFKFITELSKNSSAALFVLQISRQTYCLDVKNAFADW